MRMCERGITLPHPFSRFLSAAGVRFSGLPVPAGELGLPYGWLTRLRFTWTPSGFPRSTHARCDRFGRPLHPGAVVLSWPTQVNRPALAAFQRPALYDSCSLPSTSLNRNEASARIHLYSPARSSPACNPRMERVPLGLSPGLRTPKLLATHAGAGTGLEH